MRYELEKEAAEQRTLESIPPNRFPAHILSPPRVSVETDDELDELEDCLFSAGSEHMQRKETGLFISQEDWPDDCGILPYHYTEHDECAVKSTAFKDLKEGNQYKESWTTRLLTSLAGQERNNGSVVQDEVDILRQPKSTEYHPYHNKTVSLSSIIYFILFTFTPIMKTPGGGILFFSTACGAVKSNRRSMSITMT